ncbi:MAG: LysM peptidoglycan-binding domain-containing protein [Firmicutes bacterium]|nr:LysM peptidoglycan-binding domain-containing protein [Bacillota bacterium]
MVVRVSRLVFLILLCVVVFLGGIPTSLLAQANGWYYYVQPGDTIFWIATKVGLDVDTIRAANGLWTDIIRPGQRVFIPVVTAPANQSYSRGGSDMELLSRLIMAEAGSEPYVGQVAVGAVVMNRVESPLFPNTIAGVIYEPDAFESVSNGLIWRQPPSNSARLAAVNAISGWDPTGGALFFFNPAKTVNPYIWSRAIITQIGNHIFAR